jgi:hypothetical protein
MGMRSRAGGIEREQKRFEGVHTWGAQVFMKTEASCCEERASWVRWTLRQMERNGGLCRQRKGLGSASLTDSQRKRGLNCIKW